MLVRVDAGCSSLTELASLANLSVPTVSEGVDMLVRRGLLSRTRRDDDRRAYTLALTDKGREALTAGDREFHETANELISGLDEEQRQQLARSLQTVYEAVTVVFRERFGRGASTATSE
jgi:DNA-binding MarR family transcriptional regulator